MVFKHNVEVGIQVLSKGEEGKMEEHMLLEHSRENVGMELGADMLSGVDEELEVDTELGVGMEVGVGRAVEEMMGLEDTRACGKDWVRNNHSYIRKDKAVEGNKDKPDTGKEGNYIHKNKMVVDI